MKEQEILCSIELINQLYNHFLNIELAKIGLDQLSPSHYFILLSLINASGRLTLSEIALHINRSKSTCSTLIKKLETMNLVHRQKKKGDLRYAYIELTEFACSYKDSLVYIMTLSNTLMKTSLSQQEESQLIKYLDKVEYCLTQQNET